MRIDEVNLAHECLAEAADRLMRQLHPPESFRSFSQALLDQTIPEPWVIEITERRKRNFHAQLQGHPGKWDAGKTRSEAIAQLVMSCQELFHIRITNAGI